MNKKIKELARKAGLHDFVLEAMGIDEEIEKLVELVVRECIAAALSNDDPLTASDIADKFGVE
jgi:hypothetical protein